LVVGGLEVIELISVINRSIVITIFVFVMMVIIDYLNVLTRGRMKNAVEGSRLRQYTITSFLGSTPGCLGAFMNVSLYVHGIITFGAIVGGMIATSGDESFVMLTQFPREALILFALLFVLGIIGASIADKIASIFHIIPCKECKLQKVHTADVGHPFQPFILKNFLQLSYSRCGLILLFVIIIVLNLVGIWGPQSWSIEEPDRILLMSLSLLAIFIILTASKHYFKEHIWEHITKKHIWRVFLWTFFALLFVQIGFQYWNLQGFVEANIGLVLLISALVGMIPESGPHMVFVMMYASGIVPFSVLLTSSIAQDGHGMLPLLSYSIKDSILIKIFNFVFALIVGLVFFTLGF